MTAAKEHASLAAALVAFQAELPKVTKDKTVNTGSFSYKYADLGSVTDAVLPVLVKHGLSFVCTPRGTESGYEIVGVLMHASGETLEGALPLYGRNPQEIGSALSYGRRYLISVMTGLVADSDDDGAAANKASRTQPEPAVDWDSIADTAESLFDLTELKDLWTRHNLAKAPRVIQERVKAHVEIVKGQDA